MIFLCNIPHALFQFRMFCFSDFKAQSCEWFYGHLENRLGDFSAAKVSQSVGYRNHDIDPATAGVRDHIEKVVESLVGDNLDSTNIIRLSSHPDCKH